MNYIHKMVCIILYVIYKGFNMYELLKNIQIKFFLKLFFSFSILFFSLQSFSQLSISKKYTPSGIVNQVLKGKGVEISNVVFRGAPNSIGTFTAQNTNLGINEGIILSTGSIYNAIGKNKINDFPNSDLTFILFKILSIIDVVPIKDLYNTNIFI